jgi:hypothetical protein
MAVEDPTADTPIMDADDNQTPDSQPEAQNGESKPAENGGSAKGDVKLEDLFNDDDDDEYDELMSSAVDSKIPSSPPVAPAR